MLFLRNHFTYRAKCPSVGVEVRSVIDIEFGKLVKAKLYHLTPLEVVALVVLLSFVAAVTLAR